MAILTYATLIFDCDGVILNSNTIKTRAFYNVALPYGQAAAEELVNYHVQHGGKSRYQKFDYFISSIIGRGSFPAEIQTLLSSFADEVIKGLMKCEVASGLLSLREATPNSRWLVVSGGDQKELREVFSKRGLTRLFDGGIFGSPDAKEDILARELINGNISLPAVFLGDSRYDYEASSRAGLDFIFVSGWSEFAEGHSFFEARSIQVVDSIEDLEHTSLSL